MAKAAFRLAKKVWDKIFGMEYTVESMSPLRAGTEYIVKKHSDGHYSCSCKSWIFKSGTCEVKDLETKEVFERCCKHVRWVMVNEEKRKIQTYRYP